MQNKLQELTEKIYKEGIEKGNAEARQILEDAKTEAEKLIKKANEEAAVILTNAKKKAEETTTNTESEIKLSARQALNALKQQITDVINGQISGKAVENIFNDKDFIKNIIEVTLKNWASSGQSMDLVVLLPSEDEKALKSYFAQSAKQLLDKGVEIRAESSIKSGFQLGPKDGSYKVSFTEKDFVNFFKQYLRPKLVEMLFSAE